MPELEAVAANLGKIAAAFKDGGLFFLIGIGLFLAYLVIMAAIKHRRRATQEINLNVGQDKAAAGPCPLHSGIEAQLESLENFRQENRGDHDKIFTKLESLAVMIGPGGKKF
jgi:hypothetical protein